MRVLSAEQHRALDAATLAQDGISSLELMERAATAWAKRFQRHFLSKNREIVVSGMTTGVVGYAVGNYAGLAIAYLLQP